jgi:hypothetical protein
MAPLATLALGRTSPDQRDPRKWQSLRPRAPAGGGQNPGPTCHRRPAGYVVGLLKGPRVAPSPYRLFLPFLIRGAVPLRTPYTNTWDRNDQCIHFWDGRTVGGDLQVHGNVWSFRPGRSLVSGADFLVALPLRRLLFSHFPPDRAGGIPWQLTMMESGTHPSGGLSVSERYVTVCVYPLGHYRVHNLGDLADAAHQRILSDQQVAKTLHALDTLCEGLHRTESSVVDLLKLWDVNIAI